LKSFCDFSQSLEVNVVMVFSFKSWLPCSKFILTHYSWWSFHICGRSLMSSNK
jgi:hypothetical protein